MATRKLKNRQGVIVGEVLFDDKDEIVIASYNWYKGTNGYAQAGGSESGFGLIRMHQLLLGKHPGMHIDHINRNKLDNRRTNLRVVTASENIFNQGPDRRNKTGIRGVYYLERIKRYWAYINILGKRKNLGYYKTLEEATYIREQALEQIEEWRKEV